MGSGAHVTLTFFDHSLSLITHILQSYDFYPILNDEAICFVLERMRARVVVCLSCFSVCLSVRLGMDARESVSVSVSVYCV